MPDYTTGLPTPPAARCLHAPPLLHRVHFPGAAGCGHTRVRTSTTHMPPSFPLLEGAALVICHSMRTLRRRQVHTRFARFETSAYTKTGVGRCLLPHARLLLFWEGRVPTSQSWSPARRRRPAPRGGQGHTAAVCVCDGVVTSHAGLWGTIQRRVGGCHV